MTFAINLFFYLSLCYFVTDCLKEVCNIPNRKSTVGAWIVVLFAFTNNYNNSEIWTWYCVLVAYVLIVTFMFWGIIFFIKAVKNSKNIYVVLASIIGFLVSGAALNVTALNCILYLTIGCWGVKMYSSKKASTVCFCSALAGGLVNVLAPGNYIRHESITNTYPVGDALKSSVLFMISRLQYLLTYTPFVILLIIFFFIIYNVSSGNRKAITNPVIILFAVCVGVIIINFPVSLGYNMTYYPDRCIWVEDCGIYIGMFMWCAYLAIWIKNKISDFEKNILFSVSVSCILFVCSLGRVRDLDSYPTIRMYKELFNGDIQDYAGYWESIFSEIESEGAKEVEIQREEMKENYFISDPRLSSDKNYWVNMAIAQYYNKDSVWLIVK